MEKRREADGMRRAPADGYDKGPKRQYRRDVWKHLADGRGLRSERHALLMPSLEGDEVEVALSKGFREDHLHVVDSNPAIVATLRRRFPLINTYGVTAARACERIAAKGVRLGAANFDFTGCVSVALRAECRAIARSGALGSFCRVAFTFLRARERAGVVDGMRRVARAASDSPWSSAYGPNPMGQIADFAAAKGISLAEVDAGRATFLALELCYERAWRPVKVGCYRIAQSPMMFCVLDTISTEEYTQGITNISEQMREVQRLQCEMDAIEEWCAAKVEAFERFKEALREVDANQAAFDAAHNLYGAPVTLGEDLLDMTA